MTRRTQGRPPGPAPLFVEDLIRLDANEHLVKSRGFEDNSATITTWGVRPAASETSRPRTFVVRVTRTAQPFGGTRRWFLCPVCQRRCRVLFLVAVDGSVGCRRCLGGRYAGDYPGRARFRQLREWLLRGWTDDPNLRQLETLLAPRRRGVRRGRRVLQRALRVLARGGRRWGAGALAVGRPPLCQAPFGRLIRGCSH